MLVSDMELEIGLLSLCVGVCFSLWLGAQLSTWRPRINYTYWYVMDTTAAHAYYVQARLGPYLQRAALSVVITVTLEMLYGFPCILCWFSHHKYCRGH